MRRISYLAAAFALVGMLILPQVVQAQIEPFIGQLILVPYNFCPRGFAEAAGQILPISQHTALFSLLGTTYGGDGRTTFALPDLRGRVPISQGQGPGLSDYDLGATGGSESVSLSIGQLPSHNHAAIGNSGLASSLSPGNKLWASQDRVRTYADGPGNVAMSPGAIGNTGGNQPVGIRPPYVTLQWCIALQGVYPSRD